MRPSTLLLAFPPLISAHTVFTTLFINDANQGDGTCVRMPHDGSTATNPIRPITGTDMVCGRDGLAPVAFTCPAPAGSKLTFEFREYADGSQPGSIDISHKGPCAVYLKQVDNMTASASSSSSSQAQGDGWFKIWDSGYDERSGKWCTDKLIEANGLLSVALPAGLPTGYFLVRPELLALQNVAQGDPQFYGGCAQLFVQGTGPGKLEIPADRKVAIPGHVKATDKGLTYNIYDEHLVLPYPIPGPAVWVPPTAGGSPGAALPASGGGAVTQTQGAVPAGCLLKNANWCGFEVASYSDEDGCWSASEGCYAQAKTCYDTAPASGSANCEVWEGKCQGIQDACAAGQFKGPPKVQLVAVQPKVPGPIPGVEAASGTVGEPPVVSSTAKAAATAATSASVPAASGASASKPAETVPAPPAATEASGTAGVVSKDGKCGGDQGQTCSGSEFGGCCSQYGRCGSTKLHCGCGCQNAFGKCN